MKIRFVLLISTLTILAFAGNFIISDHAANVKTEKQAMLLSLPNGYEKAWSKVDSLIAQGLTKSALEEVVIIYNKAKTDSNAEQFVKAILYKMKLQNDYSEDSYEKSIASLKAEIKGSAFPIKPVLHSMLAEMYWRYYTINRYTWYERTETVNFKEDDMKTWDLKKLVKEVIANYVLSLNDAENLKKTKIELYDNIIVEDTDSTLFTPHSL